MEENKKETKKWFNALGRSTPFGGTKFGLTRSISNVSENVKPLLVSLKAYSEAEKKDHAKSAKEFFGETNNRNENGYITTDGTKLDFSDHHKGAPGEHRYVDHGDTRGEAAVQVELERYYGGAKALLAQNEAFLKGITEALLLTLHHTRRGEQARRVWTDFNPRPPRGGATTGHFHQRHRHSISIHAPREGGDFSLWPFGDRSMLISIHAPARGATADTGIHPAHKRRISIHAPAWGATPRSSDRTPAPKYFNPRPRVGGDQKSFKEGDMLSETSIHAPREGGDHLQQGGQHPRRHFNPRPPRGGRPFPLCCDTPRTRFQSTPPARGATYPHRHSGAGRYFNPRPPRGGRRQCPQGTPRQIPISIHAPREGGDTT